MTCPDELTVFPFGVVTVPQVPLVVNVMLSPWAAAPPLPRVALTVMVDVEVPSAGSVDGLAVTVTLLATAV